MREYLLALVVVFILVYLGKYFQRIQWSKRINVKESKIWYYDIFCVIIASSLIFIGCINKDRILEMEHMHQTLIILYIVMITFVAFRFNLLVVFRTIKNCDLRIIEESLKSTSSVNRTIEKRNTSTFKKQKEVLQKTLLEKALRSKIYLRSDLTIEILAQKTQIPCYRIPQLFAIEFNSNFNNVINGYRIKYAIKILNNKDNKQTISEIATASGFNSRSSFYRAFKASTGTIPSEYKKRQ